MAATIPGWIRERVWSWELVKTGGDDIGTGEAVALYDGIYHAQRELRRLVSTSHPPQGRFWSAVRVGGEISSKPNCDKVSALLIEKSTGGYRTAPIIVQLVHLNPN